jgi:predicted ATPase
MITADIADRQGSDSTTPIDRFIVQRCEDLAEQLFGFDSSRITSRLIDSGIFTALCTDSAMALDAAASLVQAVESKSRPAKIRLRLAIHAIDATETSMGSAADACYTHMLRRAAHPGQILISAKAYESLHNSLPAKMTLRDLGQHQMPDLSQPAQVFQLLTTDSPHVFPQIRSLNGGHHNLVTPVSRFIGREDDIQTIRDQIRSNRMVTLIGAPGIGKTRLAVQTAATMVEEMSGGAWFVEIPHIPDPSLVVTAIAAALKVVEDPVTSLIDSIVASIEHKQLLLVLDNFDLVRGACAAAIETILDRCAEVRVLASGTEPLGVRGEAARTVRPLTVCPETEGPATALSVRATEAGEMFNDFASRANPEFVLTHANSSVVARLIRAAAGIPFALQVMAHAVRTRDVGRMAAELEARIGTTDSGSFASQLIVVRTIVDWSYSQLDPASRAVLCRLSVFNGAFTQAAAQAVAPGGRESARLSDASITVTALTVSGLVTVRQQSGVPRYRLPDPVREFANERLDASERLRARKRFVDYYLRMAEKAGEDLVGTGAARMALWLEKEYPNLCAALAYCKEDPEQTPAGLQLAGELRKYWEVRGYPGEGQALLLGTAAWGDRSDRTTARADALKKAGDLAFQSGNLSAAKARHLEALSINRELGDRARQAINLNNLGNVWRAKGDHAAAQSMHEQALEINREIGDQRREAVNLHNIGNAHRDQGALEKARELYEQAIELNLKLDDHLAVGHDLNSLARIALTIEDRGEALRLYEEAIEQFRYAGSQAWVAHNLAEIERLNLRSANPKQAASPLLASAIS